jgi:uncharacterized protein (TIGR03435 family)
MMRGPMMQTVLEDRFKLKLRRDTKDVPVCVLTEGKGGHKLQVTKEGSCVTEEELFAKGPATLPSGPPAICGGFLHSRDGMDLSYRQTMAGLCAELSRLLEREVIDRTGIGGHFDIQMALSPADLFPGPQSDPRLAGLPDASAPPTMTEPLGSSVFAAVKKLGLKLDPAKASGQFLVIDHVERPSEN